MGSHKHILIVGSGSIGKRHAKNLYTLGCSISCCDPRMERCDELSEKVPTLSKYHRLEDALVVGNIDGVVICSPTFFHPDQMTQALQAGIPVLLEKPMAISLEEAIGMENARMSTGVPVLLGYSWRWYDSLRYIHNLLTEGKIGSLKNVQFHMSANLADWHPWERYQDFFMSSKKLGGGALLDESHWLDLMIWLFGMPNEVFAKVDKLSDLEIETDDTVDALCFYNRMHVSVHLDLYGRPHEKFIRFIGESGTIMWTADPNRIQISTEATQEWDELQFQYERNDMFKDLAKEFLELISGNLSSTCSLQDGIKVMEIIEAIRESSDQGKIVSLDKTKYISDL